MIITSAASRSLGLVSTWGLCEDLDTLLSYNSLHGYFEI